MRLCTFDETIVPTGLNSVFSHEIEISGESLDKNRSRHTISRFEHMMSTKVTKDQTNGHTNGHTNGYTDHYSNGGPSANGEASELFGSDPIDQKAVHEPIAIIGMGMRLPGGVHNAEAYWDLLVNGKDGRCQVPKDRYNIDTWYGPGRVTHVGTKYGHFLEELNLANIDPNFWSFTKQEAELLDPQQRLFLEVVYEAFENSGTTKWKGKDVGVYVGALGDDWGEMEMQDGQDLNPTRTYVYGDYIIANRASYEFDLKGPRYAHPPHAEPFLFRCL